MTARDEVLARIRDRARPRPAEGPAPTCPRRLPDAGRGPGRRRQLLDLLAERLTDYRATVRRAAPDRLPAAVGAALAERGARRVVVPARPRPARSAG